MWVYSCTSSSRSQSSVRPITLCPGGADTFMKMTFRGSTVAKPFE